MNPPASLLAYLYQMSARTIRAAVTFAALLALILGGSISPAAAAKPRPAAPTPKLNLSHIECVGEQVEVHFVVVNLPSGVTPLALTFTGTWPGGTGSATIPGPTKVSGPTYHYSYYGAGGYYTVTGATVALSDGGSLSLHNPGEYAGTYDCGPGPTPTYTPTPTNTPTPTPTPTATPTDHCFGVANCSGWEFHFEHALVSPATITVYARMGRSTVVVGSGSIGSTTGPTVVTGAWTQTLPATKQIQIRFEVNYGGHNHIEYAVKPICP